MITGYPVHECRCFEYICVKPRYVLGTVNLFHSFTGVFYGLVIRHFFNSKMKIIQIS